MHSPDRFENRERGIRSGLRWQEDHSTCAGLRQGIVCWCQACASQDKGMPVGEGTVHGMVDFLKKIYLNESGSKKLSPG